MKAHDLNILKTYDFPIYKSYSQWLGSNKRSKWYNVPNTFSKEDLIEVIQSSFEEKLDFRYKVEVTLDEGEYGADVVVSISRFLLKKEVRFYYESYSALGICSIDEIDISSPSLFIRISPSFSILTGTQFQ